MNKKLVIDKCTNCPYFQFLITEKGTPKRGVCFGRNKLYYLTNDPKASIPNDCPLETTEDKTSI
jgi:hypothetical protein